MTRKKLPKSTAIALIVGGDLVLLLLGWFMLVSPQRATARSTATAVQAAEVQIEQARAPVVAPSAVTQPKQPEIRTAYLYKLSKAMPTTTDMPNLLLELTQVVRSTGVQLLQISPTPTDPTTGATAITLSGTGRTLNSSVVLNAYTFGAAAAAAAAAATPVPADPSGSTTGTTTTTTPAASADTAIGH